MPVSQEAGTPARVPRILRTVSFHIATKESERYFSHFISPCGGIGTVDRGGGEFAKVGIIADSVEAVTDEQRASIMQMAEIATVGNMDVSLTFGRGLSPFRGP